MARQVERLKARTVATLKEPGYYADGGNLYLQISQAGTRSWVFRYTLRGKTRDMGLGSYITFGLAEARERAAAARRLVADGQDPIEARRAAKAGAALAESRAKTINFEQAAREYIKAHSAKWSNKKHSRQWLTTLEDHAYPVLGALSVSGIDTELVMRCLLPIWNEKPQTAGRVRARIENVLDWCAVMGYRSNPNPAAWKGNLKVLLPQPSKIRAVEHHEAMDYRQIGAFMQDLRKMPELSARALELTILSVTRTNETLGAKWSEFDMKEGLWIVPGERTKSRKPHRIPLTQRACELLKSLPHSDGFVFPGKGKGKSPNPNLMLNLMERMQRTETVHGMRAVFKTWASESTAYPREVIEMALAHKVGNAVEQAYQRGDLFERRRRLMEDWGRYCETAGLAKVVRIVAG